MEGNRYFTMTDAAWFIHHPFLALVLYFGISNLIGALPKPKSDDGVYPIVYRFAHGFAGNLLYAVQAKFNIPDPEMKAAAQRAGV